MLSGFSTNPPPLGDDVSVVAAKSCDAMLCRKCRQVCPPAHLETRGDWDHYGCFLLALFRCFDCVALAGGNPRKNIEEVDRENGIKENLALRLWHPIPFEPAIDNHQVLDLH